MRIVSGGRGSGSARAPGQATFVTGPRPVSDPDDRPAAGRGGTPRRVPPRPFASRTRVAIWLAAILLPWLLVALGLALLDRLAG